MEVPLVLRGGSVYSRAMGNMLRMAVRAALLRRDVAREAAGDPEIILKSLGVVLMAAIVLSLGLLNVVEEGMSQPDLSWSSLGSRLIDVWLVLITMLLGWVLWAFVVYLLGSRFLGGKAVYHQLLRVVGLCYGPGVLFLLVQVPDIGFITTALAGLWILIASIVGIKEVQETDWIAAVLSTVLGWSLFFVIMPAVLLGSLA